MTDGEEPMAPFAGWRIVELSSGIAASYCGKMFTDAGADVVKIEPPQGDPMRQWSAGGAPGALSDTWPLTRDRCYWVTRRHRR